MGWGENILSVRDDWNSTNRVCVRRVPQDRVFSVFLFRLHMKCFCWGCVPCGTLTGLQHSMHAHGCEALFSCASCGKMARAAMIELKVATTDVSVALVAAKPAPVVAPVCYRCNCMVLMV